MIFAEMSQQMKEACAGNGHPNASYATKRRSEAKIGHAELNISKGDLPIRTGFNSMAPVASRNMILQYALPRAMIHQEIAVFLLDQFSKVREEHNIVTPRQVHPA